MGVVPLERGVRVSVGAGPFAGRTLALSPQRIRVLRAVALAALPLVLVSVWHLWYQVQEDEARLAEERVALARVAAEATDDFIERNLATLQALAVVPSVRDPSLGLLGVVLESARDADPDLVGITLFNSNGANLSGDVAPPGTLNVADRAYFQDAMRTGRPTVSGVLIGKVRGLPVVSLAVPVQLVDGRQAVLTAALELDQLRQVLGRARPDGHTGIAVVDTDGTVVVHPDPAIQAGVTSLRGYAHVDAALAGAVGSRVVRGSSGEELFAAYAPTRAGWGVLALQPTAEAFGATRASVARAAGLLLLAVALAGGVAWLLAGRLGNLFDQAVAARLQAEQAAEAESAARTMAEMATRARDEFVATLSHDLRNPLTTIKGQVQVLQRRLEREGRLERARLLSALGLIETTTDIAAALIADLLDTSQLEAGRPLDLQAEAIDLVVLARRAVLAHQQASEAHRVSLAAGVDSLVGQWDGTRLERVLANLLGNAIKYSPHGGEIIVGVREEPGAAILAVRDHGVGVPDRDLPSVFDAYRRGTNVAGRIAGTGLGLAGVKAIVEQHGGSVAVESQEGVGSTFTVRLPLVNLVFPADEVSVGLPAS